MRKARSLRKALLMELERIYRIQHGGDRKSEEKSNPQDAELKSQDDIAKDLLEPFVSKTKKTLDWLS